MRLRRKLAIKIAWALPRWLVYWCAVRVGANATGMKHPHQAVPDLLFMEALKRWNDG